jgi:hypothetical protein
MPEGHKLLVGRQAGDGLCHVVCYVLLPLGAGGLYDGGQRHVPPLSSCLFGCAGHAEEVVRSDVKVANPGGGECWNGSEWKPNLTAGGLHDNPLRVRDADRTGPWDVRLAKGAEGRRMNKGEIPHIDKLWLRE